MCRDVRLEPVVVLEYAANVNPTYEAVDTSRAIMSRFTAVLVLVLVSACAGINEPDQASSSSLLETGGKPWYRMYNAQLGRHAATGFNRAGFESLGFRADSVYQISEVPVSGGWTLYECYIAATNTYFSSSSSNCEGASNIGTDGYSFAPDASTFPIWRCWKNNDLWITPNSNCDNVPGAVRNEWVLAYAKAATPQPVTMGGPPFLGAEVVMFEDNFYDQVANAPSMVYRVEGAAQNVIRGRDGDLYVLKVNGGWAQYVHPAKYVRGTLRARLKILGGTPGFAVASNGEMNNQGAQVAAPGVYVQLGTTETLVIDVATQWVVARIPAVFPRDGSYADLSISWNVETGLMRVVFPSFQRFSFTLPPGILSRGGFSVLANDANAVFNVQKLQMLWQDPRPRMFYDGNDSFFGDDGVRHWIPPATFTDGQQRNYVMTAYDLQRNRALIWYSHPGRPAPQINTWANPSDWEGLGVRELATGVVTPVTVPAGCMGGYGGGGFDGRWLYAGYAAHTNDVEGAANLCLVDWGAYDSNPNALITPFRSLSWSSAHTFDGYYDPAVALDGSMIRYGVSHSDESMYPTPGRASGLDHFLPAPGLAAYYPSVFSDVTTTAPRQGTYQSGGAGYPSTLAVRDLEPAYFEEWQNSLPSIPTFLMHTRNLGVLPFRDPIGQPGFLWGSTDYFGSTTAYSDWTNLAPDLLQPGRAYAQSTRFDPSASGEERIQFQTVDQLQIGWQSTTKIRSLAGVWLGAQVLFDPSDMARRPN